MKIKKQACSDFRKLNRVISDFRRIPEKQKKQETMKANMPMLAALVLFAWHEMVSGRGEVDGIKW